MNSKCVSSRILLRVSRVIILSCNGVPRRLLNPSVAICKAYNFLFRPYCSKLAVHSFYSYVNTLITCLVRDVAGHGFL